MATATNNAALRMEIDLDLTQYKKDLANLDVITKVETAKTQAAVAKIEAQGLAKREAADKAHQQRLSQMVEREAKRREIAEERARQRTLAGHTTWSQKITKQVTEIGMAVKGLAVIYATGVIKNIISDSVRFTGQIAEQSEALGIATTRYYSYVAAANAAGISASRLGQLMMRLSTISSGGGTEKQINALSRLGISPLGKDPAELFNEIVKAMNEGKATSADLSEMVGFRLAFAFATLSTKIDGSDESLKKWGSSIDTIKAKRADEIVDNFTAAIDRMKIAIAPLAIGAIDLAFGTPESRAQAIKDAERLNALNYPGKTWFRDEIARATSVIGAQMQGASAFQGPAATSVQFDALKRYYDQITMLITKERESADVKAFQTAEIVKLAEANRYNANALLFYLDLLGKVNQKEANRTTERLFGAAPVTGISFAQRGGPVSVSAGKALPAYVPPEGSLRATEEQIDRQVTLNETNAKTAESLKELRIHYAGNEEKLRAINELLGETATRQGMSWQQAAQHASRYLGNLQELAGALQDLASVHLQNELAALDIIQERESARWQARSDELRAAGLETSVLYRNELKAFQSAEKERAKMEVGLKARMFDAEKEGRLVSVVMSTAQAIIQAWATLGPIFGPIGAALAAATGAVQYAAVSEQQNPYRGYREGGWIQGPSARDDIVFRGSDGEFVSTRESAKRNAAALEYGNSGGTIGGPSYVINIGTVIGTDEWVQDNLFPQIKKALRQGHSFQPGRG